MKLNENSCFLGETGFNCYQQAATNDQRHEPAQILVTFEAMIHRILLLFILAVCPFALHAQSPSDSIQKNVQADPRLQVLVNKHMDVNATGKGKGYRVQIYFGADKAKANDLKARFLGHYSTQVHAYELYDVPNFKIRVGDFRTKMDAYRFLKKIKAEFPSAFIVESEIEYHID